MLPLPNPITPFVEYQVRESRRFIVTRYAQSENTAGGSVQKGEYADAETAYQVAYALCKSEHDAAGTPPDDMGFVYPKHPYEGVATQAGQQSGETQNVGLMRPQIHEDVRILLAMGRDKLRDLWDQNPESDCTIDGHDLEDIHAALNLMGDGEYCAV